VKELQPAQLAIWIRGKLVPQGKYCLIGGKKTYLARMNQNKWWVNFGGYAISKRILEALPRGTQIVYARPDFNTYYVTNKTKVQRKGILVAFDHQQWVLPLRHWQAKPGKIKEPKGFPTLSVSEWAQKKNKPKESRIIEDVSLPNDVRSRLAKSFYDKYPEHRPQTL
jgi:hypothetical protein